jgi:hypothetical protein
VVQLDVTSLAMDFQKTKPLLCGQHLPAGHQRQLHIVNLTTSRSSVEANSDGEGRKMAGLIHFTGN